jgi:hypothetical protein
MLVAAVCVRRNRLIPSFEGPKKELTAEGVRLSFGQDEQD